MRATYSSVSSGTHHIFFQPRFDAVVEENHCDRFAGGGLDLELSLAGVEQLKNSRAPRNEAVDLRGPLPRQDLHPFFDGESNMFAERPSLRALHSSALIML